MLAMLLLAHGALVPPMASGSCISRRSALALLAAPLSTLGPNSASASIQAKQEMAERARAREAAEQAADAADGPRDPLTVFLKQRRKDLNICGPLLADKQYDKIRQIVNSLIPIMTFRGYTGESVKARADSWAAAGNSELAAEIMERRRALLIKLSELDNGLFAAQTNNKKNMVTAEALQLALDDSIAALDAIIDKMGCEKRWQSGKCEILPLPENASLREMIY